MTKSICLNAVHEAILTFDRDHAASWCSPLVDTLELLSPGSAIEWCVEVLIETLGTGANDVLTLAELRRLSHSSLNTKELLEKGREIWYSNEFRSKFQTATAKAYEAVAAYVVGDCQRYKRGIAHTISEIALDDLTSNSDPRMQQVFHAFMSKCHLIAQSLSTNR